MTFNRNIEFWQVESGYEDLENILRTFYQSRVANPGDRTKILAPDAGSEMFYLHKFDNNSNYAEGMIVKQRMKDIPKKSRWSSNTLEDFTLESDTGFAESTYFVYIPSIKVLALMPGRYGVKIGWFNEHMKKTVGVRNFKVSIILTKNAIDRLDNLGVISAVTYAIKVANGYSSSSPMIKTRSVMEMLKSNGKYLTIRNEIRSPSKRGGGLKVGKVRGLVNTILGVRDTTERTLEELRIKGSEDADQQESYIDILEEKFSVSVALESGYALDYSECRNRVAPVILHQRNTLEGLLGDTQ